MEWGMMIPIVAILVGGMIAVTAIMSGHQRKMAELVRKNQPDTGVLVELQHLRKEVQSMRTEINSNTIAVDGIKNRQIEPQAQSHTLEQRVSQENR